MLNFASTEALKRQSCVRHDDSLMALT